MSDESVQPAGDEGRDISFNIALFYTGGDADKAKEMVEGKYRDLHIITSTFVASSLSGAFILFYNIKHLKLVDSYNYITPGTPPKNLDPEGNWWDFEKRLVLLARSGEHDEILGKTLRDGFLRAFSLTFITDLNKFLENDDDISLNRLIQKVVQDSLGLQRLEMRVFSFNTTSLEMELKAVTTRKLDKHALETQKMDAAGRVQTIEEKPGRKIPKVGEDGVKLILGCSFILSPIKGKDVTKLQVGDRIRINIVDKSPRAIGVARAFNAYDEQNGKFQPVNARIKQVEKLEGKGVEVYALLARGILARIVEEEDNIKVAMDPNYVWQGEEDVQTKANMAGLLIVLLIIAICTAVVIAVIKLLS